MKVLVMGGTQFNGLALVRELAKAGHDVTILNRGQSEAILPRGIQRLYCDRTDLEKLRDTLSGLQFDCVYDLCAYRPEDVQSMVDTALDRFGAIHILIDNAGLLYPTRVVDMSAAEWDRVVAVNLRGTFLCSRSVLPSMQKEGWGRIVP